MQSFFSHGKLLLTGEYVVLDQALALAIPTKYGQRLEVVPMASQPDKQLLRWDAFDSEGKLWLEQEFVISGNSISSKPSHDDFLASLISKAMELNPALLSEGSFHVKTYLDFPNNWGLGSSSTLVCNIAKWAQVDAFQLLDASFGGSGYDIAVGMLGGDVLYRSPDMWEGFVYNPPFKDNLYFVHLNQKQDSREGIESYRQESKNEEAIRTISNLTEEIISCTNFDIFQDLITQHEQVISSCIKLSTVKEKLFSDYPFAIKSLGAWGGDFILACGDANTTKYFKNKGYDTVIKYSLLAK